MVRTITQIAGEYGLNQDATKNLFADQEKSVLESIQNALDQQRSTSLESLSARGLGRSTFAEGAITAGQAPIISGIANQFAQQRGSLLSNIIGQGVSSDESIRQMMASGRLKSDQAGRQFEQTLGTNLFGNLLDKGAKSTVGSAVGSIFGPVGSILGSLLPF